MLNRRRRKELIRTVHTIAIEARVLFHLRRGPTWLLPEVALGIVEQRILLAGFPRQDARALLRVLRRPTSESSLYDDGSLQYFSRHSTLIR